MNIMGGTSHFLVGFKNHTTGENTYLLLQIWPKPVAGKLTGLRSGPVTIILLNEQNNEQTVF